ncbi:hypothetical protein [Desulfosporosinus fructosivorans]|uniref:hypothetical protein n=1 Tax=Desulfosporosinus fructosivorans TaxID=2018669 RepID=UPI001FB17777|nr:hypothetical protein [Desulfosporosinus fructosivorans]
MNVSLTERKPSSRINIHKILIACIMIVGLILYCYWVDTPSKEPSIVNKSTVPLLLNSGEVHTKEADITIILWFKDGVIPLETWTKLPTPDWTWTYNELRTGSEKVAVTLSGKRLIDKDEESDLYKWYTTMNRELAKAGGLIYIDERVNQTMDISSYLSKTNAQPAQWALIDNMLSIAAYQRNIDADVLAGKDRINIQLLSRGKDTEGQTVLAIPALLNEF